MSNIIHLLPDAVANQIAAGEVIQRPASAVKELMENAVDAGATSIKVVLKDAGRALIQIIDNGLGMSPADAKLCFERHATSKLSSAADLFKIKTMGFRGEAMASIAAIAQVELKTKRAEDNTGTLVRIEASQITLVEPCSSSDGTSISIKNLFYVTPARRNFLKSNSVELRHIIDEFQRQALAHPDLFFSLHHDGNELFHLPAGNLKQRITGIFGNNYAERIVPVEESTEQVSIEGYIGKPAFAKKTRGEQYFFVNNRFIKDNYLNHAINNAFDQLLGDNSFPLYILFLTVDPSHIDVNVHPTKTEIKFEDEKLIYAVLRAAVKRALGKYNISPSIDFNTETSFGNLKPFDPLNDEIKIPTIPVNPSFNPFGSATNQGNSASSGYAGQSYAKQKTDIAGWETLYQIADSNVNSQSQLIAATNDDIHHVTATRNNTFQIHGQYILTQIKSGIILIDQQAAHERILFEKFIAALANNQGSAQQSLFPQSIALSAADFELFQELSEELKALGFDIREFGKNTIVVQGYPAEIESGNEEKIILALLENYKQQATITKFDKKEQLAKSLARQAAIKSGNILNTEEINQLIDELFACEFPQVGISGKASFIKLSLTDLSKLFG
ncbi:MAG: DNA mismatch repair endonuclease MutL [Sphingobacteriaceae bacterium]